MESATSIETNIEDNIEFPDVEEITEKKEQNIARSNDLTNENQEETFKEIITENFDSTIETNEEITEKKESIDSIHETTEEITEKTEENNDSNIFQNNTGKIDDFDKENETSEQTNLRTESRLQINENTINEKDNQTLFNEKASNLMRRNSSREKLSKEPASPLLEHSTHFHSKEEIRGIVEYINERLKSDFDLKSILPLNPDSNDIFTVINDGVLLCKLINCVEPGTISISKINIKENLNPYEKLENLNLALSEASSIGVKVVSIGAQDFTGGNSKAHLILGVLWQLVRMDLMNQIARFSQKNNQYSNDIFNITPEDILINWVNQHLEKANHPRRISNFASDIQDCVNYIILMHQLDPKNFSLKLLEKQDIKERTELFLESIDRIHFKKFINIQDIMEGNRRINTIFVAYLYTCFNHLFEKIADEENLIQSMENEKKDLQLVQNEIDTINKELQITEQMNKEIDLKEKELIDKQRQLHRELQQEIKKVTQMKTLQKQQIKQLLAQLKAARNMSEEELKEQIDSQHQENKRMMEKQIQLESEMVELSNRLKEVRKEREKMEKKKEQMEQEAHKLQERRKLQINRLKKRLKEELRHQEQLDLELQQLQTVLEKTDRELFQKQREQKQLTHLLETETRDKKRLLELKKQMQKELKEAEVVLQKETAIQNSEKERQTKLQSKLTQIRSQNDVLVSEKKNFSFERDVLSDIVEQQKDELLDATLDLKAAKRDQEQINYELDEIQQQLDEVVKSKMEQLNKLKQEHSRALAHQKHIFTMEEQRAISQLNQLSDQQEEMGDELLTLQIEQNQLNLTKNLLEMESSSLSTNLLEKEMRKNEKKDQLKDLKKRLREIAKEN